MEGPNHNSTPHLPLFHLMLAVLAVIVKVVTTHYRAVPACWCCYGKEATLGCCPSYNDDLVIAGAFSHQYMNFF